MIVLDMEGCVSKIERTDRSCVLGKGEYAGHYDTASRKIELTHLQYPYRQDERFQILKLAIERHSSS